MHTDAWQDEHDKLDENYLHYKEIEAKESNDSFFVMEDFANQVNETKLQQKLFNALNRKHPFREFKFVLDNSGEYRNVWFYFKNKRYFDWVENKLATHNNL
jgi:hypothetical protein